MRQPIEIWTDSSGDAHPIYAPDTCGDFFECHEADPGSCPIHD